MLKKLTINRLLLWIRAALLVTLFDSFFMFTTNTYVPLSYPFSLIVFNVLFWTAFGCISGFFLWLYNRNKKYSTEKEGVYQLIFFLLPFALIYGIGGRIHIPLIAANSNPAPAFDNHLSFLWAALILAFLIFYFRKVKKPLSFSFIPETTVFILLFQFCSNLPHIQIISKPFSNHLNCAYSAGVLLIVLFYFITFYVTRFLRTKISFRRNFLSVVILFIVVVICLTCLYKWSHISPAEQEFSDIVPGQNKKSKKVPDVILIVLDTVRADRMSVYGNPGTTKNLEKFSENAVVFENCIASSSWTLPSHASLFTGLYPIEHGCHSDLDSKKSEWFGGRPAPLPLSDKFLTLAEVFRDNSYKTGAVISNFGYMDRWINMDQGFMIYDSRKNIGIAYAAYPFHPLLHLFCYLTNFYPKHIKSYRSADDINNEAFRLLDKFIPSPFFLFMNFMDAHGPYSPPPPFDGYFLDTPFPQLHKLKQYFLHFTKRLKRRALDSYQLTQYDGEIAYLDDELGKFFSRLKQMGIYDSSLIIITSDHGELFGEHGIYGHRVALYEGGIRVPLLIKFPFSVKANRENRMITLSDLYPTILSICNLPIPSGISGKAFGCNSSPIVSEFYDYETGKHRILYDEKYKLMTYEHNKCPELYDLKNDEQDNLAEKLPEAMKALENKLKVWEISHKSKRNDSNKREIAISKETIDGLKALGYIK